MNVQNICRPARRTYQVLGSHGAPKIFSKGLSSTGQEVPESDRLTLITLLLPACLLVVLASPASAAPGTSCTPARAGVHVAEQSEDWRKAVEALIASTASPDQPWGCVGGEVDLVVAGSSGTLTVVDARGHAVTREVISPDDVGPLGEALLAKPLVEREAEAPPQGTRSRAASPPPAEAALEASPARDPRMLIAATAGPRYAGPRHLSWGSFGVLAAVPLRPWGGGVWFRYDGFSTALDEPVAPIRAVNVGAAAYWSTAVGRIEFRSILKPSLAVVTQTLTFKIPSMPGPGPGPGHSPQPQTVIRDETQLDFRVGGEARLVVGLTKRFRAVLGLDAEVSPERLVSPSATRQLGEPQMYLPTFTLGVGVGVEVAVP